MTPRPKYPSDFEAFWEIYPKKRDKLRCYAWWKANKPDDRDLQEITYAILAQIEKRKAYSDAGLWHEEWKNPLTWLNGECWEDEIAMPAVVKALIAQRLPQFFGKQCYKCHMPARHKVQGPHGDSHYCIDHIPPKAMARYRGQGYTRDDGSEL